MAYPNKGHNETTQDDSPGVRVVGERKERRQEGQQFSGKWTTVEGSSPFHEGRAHATPIHDGKDMHPGSRTCSNLATCFC